MAHDLAIPSSVTGPAELARLERTLLAFDESMHQVELRRSSGADASEPRAGRQLDALAEANGIDLSKPAQRQTLQTAVHTTLTTAPTVTLSFASDPSAEFVITVTEWFRNSIHPQTLLRIGLQPDIAAGFVLRTPSKRYDFSLRGRFKEQRPMLIERIRSGKAVS